MSTSAEGIKAALQWIVGDDTGASSKNLWAVMMGQRPRDNFAPSDPADFGRCERLLRLIPEWRYRLHLMRPLSKYWAALVDHWDEVAASMEREVGVDWSKGCSAKRTYDLMKKVEATAL